MLITELVTFLFSRVLCQDDGDLDRAWTSILGIK